MIAAIVFTETKIKNYMEENRKLGEDKEILNGKIIIRKHYNRGAMLNFLEDKKETVKTISGFLLGLLLLLFTVMLPRRGNKFFKLGLSLCIGGAISNTADRFKRGYVIDYFSFNCKKLKSIVFNLADIFIFLGALMITLFSVFSTKGESCANKTAE
jgi:signal peptidase II